MKHKQKILWITNTAVSLALLISVQFLTRSLSIYVTGSAVNLILIASVLIGGLWCGLTVALLSPVLAFAAGIGPALPPVIPFVMIGNAALVTIWHFAGGKFGSYRSALSYVRYGFALAAGAVVKFLILWLSIVKLLLPYLKISDAQVGALSAAFSYPQLITALAGGAIAFAVVPAVLKGLRGVQTKNNDYEKNI